MSTILSYEAYPSKPVMPNPPRLHWVLVLLLDIVTRGLFEMIWLVVLANWVRRVRGRSAAFWWAIVYVCFVPILLVLSIFVLIVTTLTHVPFESTVPMLTTITVIGFFVLRIFALFTLRAELAQAPIRVRTGYWLTLFFGVAVLQFRLAGFRGRSAAV